MKKQQSIFIFTAILFLIGLFFLSNNIKKEYKKNFENNLYIEIQKQMQNIFDSQFYTQYYKTYQISNETIDSLKIIKKLQKSDFNIEYINSDNRYITIYDKSNKLKYSSISDSILKSSSKHFNYIKNHIFYSLDYDITPYGVTISNIIPLFDKQFLGTLQLNIQFDELLKPLKSYNIEPIVLLNNRYSNKINLDYSYSHKFINNRYIINQNANEYYIRLLDQANILSKNINLYYEKESNIIIVKKELYSNFLDHFADIYLFKSIEDLNYEQLNKDITLINYLLIMVGITILLILYMIYSSKKNSYFSQENQRLSQENKKLQVLADKLDYNEKKLSNLFNLQPNIMFISNGVEIVQVNKRFMGFFRHYGTFQNFKEQHKDIAELFEPYDEPHYISTQIIEGIHWLEYILQNPKQIYKTVISLDDNPHHFIIKVNEMEYVRNFQERYIVVAFVDVTQDIRLRKTIEYKSVFDENNNFDISYVIEENISYSIKELTSIIPTRQAIFKANSIDLEDIGLVSQKVTLIARDIELKWNMVLSIKNVSYLYNMVSLNFDADIEDNVDGDIKDMMYTLIKTICSHITNTINSQKQDKLVDLKYILDDVEVIDGNNISIVNLYKFTLFIESEELNIFIEFDKSTYNYIKQIQMLGAFFG